jgi:hypothetical protein
MANVLSVAGPNSKYGVAGAKPAGFLGGLWHGLISPLAFIISLFNKNVRMYEIHNNGGWYDFGFCIGAGIIFGNGTHQSMVRVGVGP